jgi:hypothetical protein
MRWTGSIAFGAPVESEVLGEGGGSNRKPGQIETWDEARLRSFLPSFLPLSSSPPPTDPHLGGEPSLGVGSLASIKSDSR